MADVAQMDIVIGSKIDGAINGLRTVGNEFTKFFNLVGKGAQDVMAGAAKLGNVLEGLGAAFGEAALTAGIALAVAGLTWFIKKLFETSEAEKEIKKANEELAKSFEKADEAAIKNSQKEITAFQSLINIAQDSTASMKLRNEAVEKLQKNYPDYLGNLDKEKILYGDLTPVIDQTTEALLNQAYAQAAGQKAAEAGTRVFELTQKKTLAQVKYNAALAEFNSIQNKVVPKEVREFAEKELYKAKDALDIVTYAFYDAQLEQATFLGQQENYTKLVGTLHHVGTAITETTDHTKKLKQSQDDLWKSRPAMDSDKLSTLIYKLTQGAAVAPVVDLSIKPITQDKLNKAIPTGVTLDVPLNIKLTQKEIDDLIEKIRLDKLMEDFNKQMTDVLKNTISGMFASIGEAIGEGKNPFSAMFKVLGDGMKQLGKALIEFGVQAGIIKKVLEMGILSTPAGPFIAIAAGIALEALGATLQSHMKMASGGIVTGPTQALIGEAGPEVVFPLDRLRDFIQPAQAQVVVLETQVRGNDLYLLQSRTQQRRNRTY